MPSMGVDLSGIIRRRETSLRDHSGWTVSVDAYNILYQFLSSIRQPDGTPLMDESGRITSHVSGVFYRSVTLLENGIVPVYVFDGKPSRLKARTLEERRLIKEKNRIQLEEAVESGDVERARSLASRINTITGEMIGEVKTLLDFMGLPWVQAPSEGEAQASAMCRDGTVNGVVSQDYDCLLFGASRVLRNFAANGRRKLPGKSFYVNVTPEILDLSDILETNGISQEQLIDIGIMIGTDFNKGLERVGAKTALKLVKKHGDIFSVLKERNQEIPNLEEVRNLFLNPPYEKAEIVKTVKPDIRGITGFLCEERGFSAARIQPYLARLEEVSRKGRQSSLDLF